MVGAHRHGPGAEGVELHAALVQLFGVVVPEDAGALRARAADGQSGGEDGGFDAVVSRGELERTAGRGGVQDLLEVLAGIGMDHRGPSFSSDGSATL